jgi:glyoxylase-like metal-dependent hydrolase (beta-lactamase superfamily II)
MFTLISVPTPFQIGPVNTYLAGRTLVDPGPNSEEAWTALTEGLEAAGTSPEAIEQVLVTHAHMDHFGLARRFRELGARVVASADAVDLLADYRAHYERERAFFVPFFEKHGVSRSTAEAITGVSEAFLQYAPSVEVDHAVGAGDTVDVAGTGTTLTVDPVDGHGPGELLFGFEADGRRTALVGDHVLEEITPNPLLRPPPSPDEPRPRVLPAFNRSLERLRDAEFDRMLPGHRGTVEVPGERVAEILAAHERRTATVRDLVEGPTTAAEVMSGLFGDLPVTEQFPGMSEAVGHLDVLEARGVVAREERGGTVVYERTDDG